MQRSTNLNLYLPENGDTQDITQISWNFDTLDGAVLTKSSQTLTSTQKSNVRTNLGLGTAATKDSVNNLTTTASGSVLDARVGPLLAQSIFLESTDDTWAEIWDKISALTAGKPATIYVNNSAIGTLTGSAFTSGSWSGTITRTSSGTFDLLLKSNGNTIVGGHIVNATSSSSGTFTYRNYGEAPIFQSFSMSTGANNFTVANGTMMELVFFAAASTRRGKALIYVSSGTVYHDDDLGSNLAISGSSNTMTVTVTGGGCTMQCTVYGGSITAST